MPVNYTGAVEEMEPNALRGRGATRTSSLSSLPFSSSLSLSLPLFSPPAPSPPSPAPSPAAPSLASPPASLGFSSPPARRRPVAPAHLSRCEDVQGQAGAVLRHTSYWTAPVGTTNPLCAHTERPPVPLVGGNAGGIDLHRGQGLRARTTQPELLEDALEVLEDGVFVVVVGHRHGCLHVDDLHPIVLGLKRTPPSVQTSHCGPLLPAPLQPDPTDLSLGICGERASRW
jgi:hypothetical protein